MQSWKWSREQPKLNQYDSCFLMFFFHIPDKWIEKSFVNSNKLIFFLFVHIKKKNIYKDNSVLSAKYTFLLHRVHHTECQFDQDTPETLCQCDCTLCLSPWENNTFPLSMSAQVYTPIVVCVFCAGTLLIGAQTWTECSTSMQATGQCSSSGSWTERKTLGTTSPSSPPSSVSAAAGPERDISVHVLPPILSAKLDFWDPSIGW